MNITIKRLMAVALLTAVSLLTAGSARAHCDTMDGPVVKDGRAALDKRDLGRTIKWIAVEQEPELKKAFARALSVRKLGGEARELADQFFFETLVRLHRESEGAPYTGLKPAGQKVDPAIAASDQALESGDVNALVKEVSDEVAAGIRHRFTIAFEKRRHAEKDAEAGRAYVAAYVEFVHYIEAIHTAAASDKRAHDHSAVTPH